jgi:hypothetical protein
MENMKKGIYFDNQLCLPTKVFTNENGVFWIRIRNARIWVMLKT